MSAEGLPEGALAELLDAAPDGIVVVGSDGRVAFGNDAAGVVFGYARGELVGIEIERLIPDRYRMRHVRDRAAYADNPRRRPMGLGLQLQGLRKDGSEVPVEISLAPMAAGTERLVVAIVRDATEQREIEAERLHHARSHAVEQTVAGLGAIVWEAETPDREALTYLGGREETLLGYPRAQWLQPGFWLSVVHPDDRIAALTFAETARQQETFELAYRLIAANGAVRHVRDIISVTRGPTAEIERLRGVIFDITERRELENRIAQAQKMEAVGQLAGGIAHDFNNLLTIVSGYARRLSTRAELADTRDDLEQIITAADRAAQLVKQLLAFARRGQTEATLLDLTQMIRELEPMLRRLIDADVVFDFQLDPCTPQVMMDHVELEQIIMNLILNASDAMRSGGGTLTLTTAQRTLDQQQAALHGVQAGEYAFLSVADTGTGIPPDDRARIFEPFFTTKGARGTGMGLATVYAVVDQAGGYTDLDTTVGQGTTFRVLIPRAAAPKAPEPVIDEQGNGKTLLLVEDEGALRRLVGTMLRDEGYTVLEAENGYDAITAAERHRGQIDLLITDVVIPRLSGPELAQQLKTLRPGLQVLFMSGYTDSRLVQRGVEQAKVKLLIKPFTPDQLLTLVHDLIEAGPAR
jgi:two-component system, cell cycle sensor histidine kinase and response regulator CckA